MMSDIRQRPLDLNCTLQDLELYDLQIESSQPGRRVSQAFDANPLIPGVILTEQGQFFGMISRRRFLESMSRPFGLHVFSRRPLKDLYQFTKTDILVLAGNTSILDAAQESLKRSPELLYEPIVVQTEPQVYRLLDVHQLLIAQSHIHQLATELIAQLYQQLEKANQELQHLATVDSLTQTANRRQFDEYLNTKWRQLARQQAPLSLILCDIDFFKHYNDTYGHPAGDSCLQQVAQLLHEVVKRPGDLLARYGGEEFAVILPNTEADGAVHLAENMRQGVKALEIPHASSSVYPYVTISLGVASLVPHPDTSPEMLLEAADRALYQAKASGRDRFALHADKFI